MDFWKWFFLGTTGKPGLFKFFDRWLFLHIIVGFLLSWLVPSSLSQAANTVLLPLVAIFIGLSFAWGGNAQALLQTEEIGKITDYHPGGFEEYVYTYQTAILVILITVSAWGLAGLALFDKIWPTYSRPTVYFSLELLLFFLTSLTLRECWHVVLGAQWMLLARRNIKKHDRTANR